MKSLKLIQYISIALEIPLIVLICELTGWNAGWVVLGVMVVGTPLLWVSAEWMHQRFIGRQSAS